MSGKSKKQFGIWMDTHHATIAGRSGIESGEFIVLGQIESAATDSNSSEKAANNQEIGLTHKFFKEIAAKMTNVDEVHVTGTGQIQEQFIHYLADTPQFKNVVASESTSNPMSDEQFTAYLDAFFS